MAVQWLSCACPVPVLCLPCVCPVSVLVCPMSVLARKCVLSWLSLPPSVLDKDAEGENVVDAALPWALLRASTIVAQLPGRD